MTYQLHHGNMLDILPMMERESIDAIVTDPPYGLGFMGKDWDHGVPGEHFWREAYRVAKPGAHLLAFGGTRTFHRLACAIEDAGWEIRDTVMWVYGQGFPKSHDVSKAIDREAGAEREVVDVIRKTHIGGTRENANEGWQRPSHYDGNGEVKRYMEITDPATPAAAEWDGWGTALKPAWEPIIVARKPLQGTVAENVQRYGTGAMNVAACRIGVDEHSYRYSATADDGVPHKGVSGAIDGRDHEKIAARISANRDMQPVTVSGRWPANLIHDGSAEVLAGFPVTSSVRSNRGGVRNGGISFSNQEITRNGFSGHGGAQNYEAGYTDTGSAARFFYCAKASKQDRDEGLEGFVENDALDFIGSGIDGRGNAYETQPRRNHHPTVKPTALMRYLCRLVTPPAGVILDPFMGSGSTGKAAILEGFNFVGVDTEIEYVEIAARRIEHACGKVGIVIDQPMMFDSKREMVDRPKQLILL